MSQLLTIAGIKYIVHTSYNRYANKNGLQKYFILISYQS